MVVCVVLFVCMVGMVCNGVVWRDISGNFVVSKVVVNEILNFMFFFLVYQCVDYVYGMFVWECLFQLYGEGWQYGYGYDYVDDEYEGQQFVYVGLEFEF